MARDAGKRGRAVVVNTNVTAQGRGGEGEQEFIAEQKHIVTNVTPVNHKSQIVDLYSVDEKSEERQIVKPFIHQVQLHGPQGEIVRVWALFDEGAMS